MQEGGLRLLSGALSYNTWCLGTKTNKTINSFPKGWSAFLAGSLVTRWLTVLAAVLTRVLSPFFQLATPGFQANHIQPHPSPWGNSCVTN